MEKLTENICSMEPANRIKSFNIYTDFQIIEVDGVKCCAIPNSAVPNSNAVTIAQYCSHHPDKPYLPRYIQRLIAKNQRELLRANWHITDWQVFGKTIVLTLEK